MASSFSGNSFIDDTSLQDQLCWSQPVKYFANFCQSFIYYKNFMGTPTIPLFLYLLKPFFWYSHCFSSSLKRHYNQLEDPYGPKSRWFSISFRQCYRQPIIWRAHFKFSPTISTWSRRGRDKKSLLWTRSARCSIMKSIYFNSWSHLAIYRSRADFLLLQSFVFLSHGQLSVGIHDFYYCYAFSFGDKFILIYPLFFFRYSLGVVQIFVVYLYYLSVSLGNFPQN